MADARHQTIYMGAVPHGLALHNASQPANTTAPPGFLQDKEPYRGSQDLGLDLEQMFPASVESFNDSYASVQQDYSTEEDLTQSQQRDDDPIATVHHQSLYQDQAHSLQEVVTNNADRYLQVPSGPWNSFNAAHDLQQNTSVNLSYPTPAKQQGFMVSDEGYYTVERSQQDTRSIRSGRSGSFAQAVDYTRTTPRFIPPSQRRRIYSQPQSELESMAAPRSTARKTATSDAGSSIGPVACDEEDCDWTGKTQSDLKKHVARHKTEHVCDVGDCTRRFATVNDLDRHKVSVHRIRLKDTRIYRCFGNACKNPRKDWPRKDNFKSHLRKTHPNEDEEELVRQSDLWWDSQQQESEHPEAFGQFPPGPEREPPMPYHDQFHGRPASLSDSPANVPPLGQDAGEERMTPHYQPSNPDSGYQRTNPFTPTPLSNHPYAPLGVGVSNLIPDTPQYIEQQNRLQQRYAMGLGGYHDDENALSISQMATPSSGMYQRSGGTSARNQQSLQPHGVVPTATPHFSRHASFGGHPMSQSLSQGQPPSMHGIPPQMMRSTSGVRSNTLDVSRLQGMQQHARTVADPFFLEQDRVDMDQSWAAHAIEASAAQDYSNTTEDLTQVGHAGIELLNQAVDENRVPRITVDLSDTRPSRNDAAASFSVEHLRQFMQTYANRVDSDQDRTAIRFAMRSLESTTGAASSELSLTDRQADDYIGEMVNEAGKAAFRCMFPSCRSNKASWALRSEIKKHLKRHTKPFGCTYEKCFKRFGSKSDWMRHEVKRHAQQEYWRCAILVRSSTPDLQPCCKIFGKREQFTSHLGNVHHIAKGREINTQVMQQHINAGFQPQYWCGFCKQILRLTKKGKEGYHERYDHIAKHISEEERCIDDWVAPNERVPKREVQARRLRARRQQQSGQIIADANEPPDDDEGDISQDDSTGEDSLSSTSPSHEPPAPPAAAQPSNQSRTRQEQQRLRGLPAAALTGRKRSATVAGLPPPQQSARRVANFWICDVCQLENLLATSPGCGNCQHMRCPHCTPVFRHVRDDN